MGGITKKYIFAVILSVFFLSPAAFSQQVKLKFIVMNSSESQEREVPVKYYLPPDVRPENVLDPDGLNVIYDVEAKKYCVVGKITLGPKESRTYQLQVQDIWQIPDDKLNSLSQYSQARLKTLEKSNSYSTAKNITESVLSRIDSIKASQASQKSISKRVEEYYVNKNSLSRVERDVFTLDQLVAEAQSGMDKKTAKISVEVKNPSDTEKREIPVKYYLPQEISLSDVKDTAGFDLRYDHDRQQAYLEKKIEFEPGETKKFDIQVNDIWDSTQFDYEVESVEKEVEKINTQLLGTAFEPIGEEIGKQIKELTDEIKSTEDENLSLKERIVNYRENMDRMEMVRSRQNRLRDLILKFQMARAGDKGDVPSVGDKGAEEKKTKNIKDESKEEFGGGQQGKAAGGGLGRGMFSAPVEAKTQPNIHRGGGIQAIRGLKGIILVSKSIFKGWEPKVASTWLIILYIIIFLGLFAGFFYVLWWIQSKKTKKRKPLVK